MDNHSVDRREFISNVCRCTITAGLIAPVLGSAADAMDKSKEVPMEPIVLDLSKPECAVLGQTGGALKVPDPHDKKKPIIVCRTSETAVAAFSSKCTHWGCEVALPVDGAIKCKCHGSMFDTTGKVTHGPAKKNLPAFAATLDGSLVTIREEGR
jgi:Rieske Fe-S protein